MSRISPIVPLVLTAWLAAPAQDFQELLKKTTEFTLSNGMRFVVVERHDTPTVAARISIAAGAVNDPPGQSGMARLLERIVLAGPETVGSRDAAAERKALDTVEDVRNRIEAERSKGSRADESKLAALGLELSKASGAATALGNPGEYTQALSEAGIGWTVNAGSDLTTWDATIPSNRVELWFLLQAQALHRPSFRRFYEEREELAGNWRTRVEKSPFAMMMALAPAEAFVTHPYRQPVQGWGGELEDLRLSEARRVFEQYWTPGNIAIALAGDITAEEARRLAERHFGAIPARTGAPLRAAEEPRQTGPRVAAIENAAQPLVAVGYKRPDQLDRDDAALEVLRSLLAAGGNAWLTKELVETKHLATSVQAQPAYPGGRYPSLFLIVAAVAPGHTAEEVEKAVTEVLGRLQNAKPDEAALERARAATRMALLSKLSDNAGIAGVLSRAAIEYGDWRKTFERVDAANRVTADQIQAAALKYLTPSRRTSVYVNAPPPTTAPARGGAR